MQNKLNSKTLNECLDTIKLFIDSEVKNLNELRKNDIELYSRRTYELSDMGFTIHCRHYTNEVIGISFGNRF